MAEMIEFVDNYNDRSTDNGFQFEFRCNRCGTGYRTKFQPWTMGTVTNVLDGASSIFGGLFGQAANIGERVRSAGWQKARDDAFAASLTEIKPSFVQCPRCQSWVCRTKCWNTKKGLCKECAPDIGVEMAAAQASRTKDDIWANAATSAEDAALIDTKNFQEGLSASCPSCGASLATNAKFCPECGAKIKSEMHCTECGSKLQPGAKFCAECGTKVAG